MRNTHIIITIAFLTAASLSAQQAHSSLTALTVPGVYGVHKSEASASAEEVFLPYAEPLFGMDEEEYQEHMSEKRQGSLLNRTIDLKNMELQAVYADSKMNEINMTFNAPEDQEVLVSIYDQTGVKVKSMIRSIVAGQNSYAFVTSDLGQGFYNLVVVGDEDQFLQRFIIN